MMEVMVCSYHMIVFFLWPPFIYYLFIIQIKHFDSVIQFIWLYDSERNVFTATANR